MIVFGIYGDSTTRLRRSIFIALTLSTMESMVMTLRHVLSLTLALFFTLPIPSNAQQLTKFLRESALSSTIGSPDTPSPTYEAYKLGLRDLGYSEGTNILIERRYAEGRLDRMAPFVQEFVQQKVDVILGVNNVIGSDPRQKGIGDSLALYA